MVKADSAGLIDEPPFAGSKLDQQYHATAAAIDVLINFQGDEARARDDIVQRFALD